MLKSFLSRYKYYVIGALVVFVLLTLFLVFPSEAPQSGALHYQLF